MQAPLCIYTFIKGIYLENNSNAPPINPQIFQRPRLVATNKLAATY